MDCNSMYSSISTWTSSSVETETQQACEDFQETLPSPTLYTHQDYQDAGPKKVQRWLAYCYRHPEYAQNALAHRLGLPPSPDAHHDTDCDCSSGDEDSYQDIPCDDESPLSMSSDLFSSDLSTVGYGLETTQHSTNDTSTQTLHWKKQLLMRCESTEQTQEITTR